MPPSQKANVDRYYELHDRIEQAMRRSDYQTVAACTMESLPLISDLVAQSKREFGEFDITESVAVHTGGRVLAALGRTAELREMHRVLSVAPETQEWARQSADFIEDVTVADRILSHLRESPGTLQSRLKDLLAYPDGRRLANVCYWLAKVGRLNRQKSSRSYCLTVGAVP